MASRENEDKSSVAQPFELPDHGYRQPLIEPWPEHLKPLHRQALASALELYGIGAAIDVGANRGQFAQWLRHEVGFKGPIFSFEPNPAAYEDLARAAAADPLWQALPIALGADDRSVEMTITRNDQCASMLTPIPTEQPSGSTPVRKVAVPQQRLTDLLAPLRQRAGGVERFFLKLDTQGYDLEVSKGIRFSDLPAIPLLQIELSFRPLYAGQPDAMAAFQFFRGYGYMPLAFVPNVADRGYRWVEADCLMAR